MPTFWSWKEIGAAIVTLTDVDRDTAFTRLEPRADRVDDRDGGRNAGPLRLHLIGQMRANDLHGGVPLPRVRKTRALLAILAMAAPRPVLREHITALLWSTREREQARASLRQSVHELQELGLSLGLNWLQTGRQHLRLDAECLWLDVKAICHATAADPQVLDLLQGEMLEDLVGLDKSFDDWIETETRRLHDGASVLAGLVLEQQTDLQGVINASRRLVAISPASEAGWRRLITPMAIVASEPWLSKPMTSA